MVNPPFPSEANRLAALAESARRVNAPEPAADSLDAAVADFLEAIPTKRYFLHLEGDWEDGWIATAEGRNIGGGYWEATTAGRGWGADRGGLPTPAAALRALAAQLRERAK